MSYINFIKLSKFIDGERPTAEKFNSIFALFERKINELYSSLSNISDSGSVVINEGNTSFSFDFNKKWATEKDIDTFVIGAKTRGNDISNINQLIGSASNLNPLTLSGEREVEYSLPNNTYEINLEHYLRVYIGQVDENPYEIIPNEFTFVSQHNDDLLKLITLKKPNENLSAIGDYKYINLVPINDDGTLTYISNTILSYSALTDANNRIKHNTNSAWLNGIANPSNASFNVIPDLNTLFGQDNLDYNLQFDGPDGNGYYTVTLPKAKFQQTSLKTRITSELSIEDINYDVQLKLPQQLIETSEANSNSEFTIPTNFMFLKSFEPYSEWRNVEYRYVDETTFKVKLPANIGNQCLNNSIQMYLVTVGNDITTSINDLQIKYVSHNHSGASGETKISIYDLADLYKYQTSYNKYFASLNKSYYLPSYLHRDGYRYGSDSQNKDNSLLGSLRLDATSLFGSLLNSHKIVFGNFESSTDSRGIFPGNYNRGFTLDSWIGQSGTVSNTALVLNSALNGNLTLISGKTTGIYSKTKNIIAIKDVSGSEGSSSVDHDFNLSSTSYINQTSSSTYIHSPSVLSLITDHSDSDIILEASNITLMADSVKIRSNNFEVLRDSRSESEVPDSSFNQLERATDVNFSQENLETNQEGYDLRNNIPINRKGNIYYYLEFQLPDDIKGAKTFDPLEIRSAYSTNEEDTNYNPYYSSTDSNYVQEVFDYFPEQFKTIESYNNWVMSKGYIDENGDLQFSDAPQFTPNVNQLYSYHLAYRMAFKEHMFFNFKNGIQGDEEDRFYHYSQNLDGEFLNIYPFIFHPSHLEYFKSISIHPDKYATRVDKIKYLMAPFKQWNDFEEKQNLRLKFPLAPDDESGFENTKENNFIKTMYPIIWTKVWSEKPLVSFSFDYVREAIKGGDDSIRIIDRGFLFNFDFEKGFNLNPIDSTFWSDNITDNMPHTFQFYKLKNPTDRFNLDLELPKFNYFDMYQGKADNEMFPRLNWPAGVQSGDELKEYFKALPNGKEFYDYIYQLSFKDSFIESFNNTYTKHQFEDDDLNIIFGSGFFLKRKTAKDEDENYNQDLSQYAINSACRMDIILDLDNRLGLPSSSNLDGSLLYSELKKLMHTEKYNIQSGVNMDERYAYGIDHGHFTDAHCNLSINIRKTDKDNFSTKNRKVNIVYSDFFNDWFDEETRSTKSDNQEGFAAQYHTELYNDISQDFSLRETGENSLERFYYKNLLSQRSTPYLETSNLIEDSNEPLLSKSFGDGDGACSTFFSSLFLHFVDNKEKVSLIEYEKPNALPEVYTIQSGIDNIDLLTSQSLKESKMTLMNKDTLFIKLTRDPMNLDSNSAQDVMTGTDIIYNIQAYNPYYSFPTGLLFPLLSFNYIEEYRAIQNNNQLSNSTLFKKMNQLIPSMYKFQLKDLPKVLDSLSDPELVIEENYTYPKAEVRTKRVNIGEPYSPSFTNFVYAHKYSLFDSLGLCFKFIKDRH